MVQRTHIKSPARYRRKNIEDRKEKAEGQKRWSRLIFSAFVASEKMQQIWNEKGMFKISAMQHMWNPYNRKRNSFIVVEIEEIKSRVERRLENLLYSYESLAESNEEIVNNEPESKEEDVVRGVAEHSGNQGSWYEYNGEYL